MIKTEALRRRERRQALLTVVFTIISVIYLMPVLLVLINSLKANAFVNTETFKLPTAESFVGLKNYVKGMTFGNFAFYKVVFYSFFITITSTALILLCTSMAAWYISRVGSLVSKIVYYLCVFSMVVPFQMVMYTLARTADQAHLNTPWTIPVIYLASARASPCLCSRALSRVCRWRSRRPPPSTAAARWAPSSGWCCPC